MHFEIRITDWISPIVTVSIVWGLVILAPHTSFAVQSTDNEVQDSNESRLSFSEAEGVIPLENRSRRKWDAPLVADLDQDGRLDLLLTEHSYRLRMFWNDGETFSEPQDIYEGDSHGVTAGDVDNDGLLDLIVSQGGGDGTNPRNPVLYQVNRDRTIVGGDEFPNFERSRGRATKLFDSNGNGVLDLLLTAFPLKTQTKGANDFYLGKGNKEFEFVAKLPRAQWMGFRALLTDFNNDNRFDVLFYGGKNILLAQAESDGTFRDVSEEVLGVAANTSFVSSVSEIDFDNDGDFDLFLTRTDHPFDVETFFDAQQRCFAFFTRFKPFKFDDLTIEGDFKMENLQMAYPHFDVFVGADRRKLEFDVERHGHKDFVLKPEEAEGWPEEMEEKGLYVGHLGNGIWRIAGDTKSATAGVVHNVISKPSTTEKMELPSILLENKDGHFADVTTRLGIKVPEQTTGAVSGDFDNDGWADLFVILHGSPASPTEEIIYLNREGKWFERAKDHGIVNNVLGSTGGSGEAFDYDDDGDLDLIYCNERGKWHFMINDGLAYNKNNYVIVKVGSSPSGKATAMGAQLTLETDGNVYRRIVGATSAAFGQSLNNHLHVGIGKNEKIDRAEVRWSNGETELVEINEVNKAVSVGKF